MSSKINLQTCEYARKSSIFQDNQLISANMLIDAALAGVLVVVAKRMEMPIYAANKN